MDYHIGDIGRNHWHSRKHSARTARNSCKLGGTADSLHLGSGGSASQVPGHLGIITVIVSIVDYVVPMWFTKVTGGSKSAERGAIAGLILGIIWTPLGMILGSFLGALLSEWYYNRQGFLQAFKAAIGSFLGFITGTGLKIFVSAIMMWKIVAFIIP